MKRTMTITVTITTTMTMASATITIIMIIVVNVNHGQSLQPTKHISQANSQRGQTLYIPYGNQTCL